MALQPIRVLHFADLHIGIENYGGINPHTGLNIRVHDFIERLDEIVAYAHTHEADLIVFAGDAFQNSRPDPTNQRAFARRVLKLAQIAPVVLLVGNHDVQASSSKASSVDIYSTLSVPNVYVAEQYDVFEVETKRGRVVVGTAPFPIRARLLESFPDLKTIREVNDFLQEAITSALDDLAERADALAGDAPRLLTGHFTVGGAKVGSERTRLLGTDESVGLGSLADPRWDYVALGHVHKFQDLTAHRAGVPPVVYSGSIERVDFGEEGDDKGFCWVSLARTNTTYEFVPVAARPMVTLSADCREDSDPTTTMIKLIRKYDLDGAIVRVRVQLGMDNRGLLDEARLRKELKTAGVHHVAGLEAQVERADRLRLAGSMDDMTHEQLLERYFASKGYSVDDVALLMGMAAPLMTTG